ncbi:MAG: thiamine phosphate synthase, partial [Firmicutes bacterium]|nr:thiamine phosphate synthase [Bacillota bacterium]
ICINDRADLALLAVQSGFQPWGLHLGQGDLPPSEARRLPGLESLHLGTSTHGDAEWQEVDGACDHAGMGPFRATSTKTDHAEPIGLEGIHRGSVALRAQGVAPIAIGGLTLGDATSCFDAGAESLAMVGEILPASDPGELLWQAQVARWKVRPPLQRGQGVALIGGSGSGKSILAQALARRTGMPWHDLDEVVTGAAGKSIARIFAEEGEAVFRKREEASLLPLLEGPCILALGGGAWESEVIRHAVRQAHFQPLWIAERPVRAWARVALDPSRPLAADRDTFMERWRQRTSRWAEAPMVMPLGRSAEDLATALGGNC